MIKVINIDSKAKTPVAEGHVRNILGPSDDATRVRVAVEDVDLGKTCRIAPADMTQVVYILEGRDAAVTCTALRTSRASAMCDPMKPAPPVSRTLTPPDRRGEGAGP